MRIGAIVEPVVLPALARFTARVSEAAGIVLPATPPHVTLYTRGEPRGIDVRDAAALAALTVSEFAPRHVRRAR